MNTDHTVESCEINVEGNATMIDPSYKAAGPRGPFATGYEFEATGRWVVTTTKMADKSMGERNQTLNAKRAGARFAPDAELSLVDTVGVDAGLMAFYPESRGEIVDWKGFCEELFAAEQAGGGSYGAIRELQGVVLCTSGFGDGSYSVFAKTATDGQVGEVEVDFTPSAAVKALFGL